MVGGASRSTGWSCQWAEPVTMAPGPQLTYLDRVVMEIIETERTYVRDLRMIVEDYLAHIIETSDLSLRPEQVCALFGNIEDIYEFNSELLQALDLCDHDPVAVARCFVLKSDYFEIYTQYCTNYPNSVAALTECMRNKSLAEFFRNRQASLQRSLPLGSYLLKPVQRILKYHLLLQEIAKHFDPQEDGYEILEEAIYTMTGVAWYINDMKRKHEHAVRLQEVQSLLWNWTGSDLTTYGELVLEGTFKVHRGRKERTLFLLERMLLICKRRGEHFLYKTHISCSTLMFIESSKDSLSFSVAHYKQPKQAQSMQAKNLEEKKLWAHHIKRIILENHYAIIPQKAKEAILHLDSVYPPHYRYSPDRLKKSFSCQSEDFQPERVSAVQPQVGGASLNRRNQLGGTESMAEQFQPPGPDQSSDPDLPRPPKEEALGPDGESEPSEETSSAAPDSDSKTLSSGESSEDDDDQKEAAGREGGAESILPSSVLDKASVIAQHFSSSVRRGSMVQDGRSPDGASPRLPSRTGSMVQDGRSPDGASPRLPSRTGSMVQDGRSPDGASPRLPSRTGSALSLCADATDRVSPPDAMEASELSDLASPSPLDSGLFDGERRVWRRRDSTLSKQDQLLIGKIKTYYETAASRNATFSLQRRESLTSIPTGLVRSSVTRLNSIPKEAPWSSGPEPREQPHSPSEPVHLGPADPPDPASPSGLHFRPSSEVIQVWQAMEREFTSPPGDQDPHKTSRTTSSPDRTLSGEPGGRASDPQGVASDPQGGASDPQGGASASDPQGGASDPSTDRSSSLKPTVSGVNSTRVLKDTLKASGSLGPRVSSRVVQLRVEVDEAGPSSGQNQLDNEDRRKNKVLHLARQYSQRIKGSGPLVQRSPGLLGCSKTLACVVEEESPACCLGCFAGKVSRTLPRRPRPQTPTPTEPPVPGVPCRSRGLSPGRPQNLHGAPLQVESFKWPDVSELRTMYIHSKSPAGLRQSVPDHMWDRGPRRRSTPEEMWDRGPRRRTTPDQIWDHGPGRRSSCSSGLLLGVGSQQDSVDLDSLDLRLSELQELQDQVFSRTYPDHYIAAETPLLDDPEHKLIVLEKVLAEPPAKDQDQDYIQIRSPTSREKISIMAVTDRCRAYQVSDEYSSRSEPAGGSSEGVESQRARGTNRDQQRPKETSGSQENQAETGGAKPDGGQQNLVKTLRQRFQSLN